MNRISTSAIFDMVNKKGFSMVELMVTIAIMALMTGAVFVNLAGNRKTKGVETEARKLVAVIRETQSNALTGKTPADGTVPCGWGIYYNAVSAPGEYKVYYNTSTSKCSVVNALATDRQYISPVATGMGTLSTAVLTTSFGNNVRFDDSIIGDKVYFTIPYGRIFNQSGSAIGAPLKLLLKSVADSTVVQHTICVFSSGRVDDMAGDVNCGTI